MSEKTYPAAAFRFLAPAMIEQPVDSIVTGSRRFVGIAYSGEPITDHGYFGGPIAFDLATLSCATPAPVLQDHEPDDTVGLIETAAISDSLTITGKLFADIDDGASSICAKADAGFPWQLSVGIFPGSIDEVQAGASVNLNGRSMTGPLTIFRNARVREVSFCALGADPLTSARVFNQGDSLTVETTEILMTAAEENHEEIQDANSAEGHEVEEAAADAGNPSELQSAEGQEMLKAENIELKAQLQAVREELAAFKAAKRKEAVEHLFSALNRDASDEAVKPYMDMSEATFSAVSADMLALKPEPAAHLFRAVATGPAGDSGDQPTFSTIAAEGLRQLATGKN